MKPSALDRAREMWASLAGVPVTFPPRGGVSVVASPESRMCPPQWAGVGAFDGGILATVPTPDLIEPVHAALLGLLEDLDLAQLQRTCPVLEALGPATLAYLNAEDFAAAHTDSAVERLPAADHDVRTLIASVDADEVEESGLAEITSAAFVIRWGREVVAASGYRPWASVAAHLSVLTAPEDRGRGLARTAASAAVADALTNGLLPQWRARPVPSRRVARALGFREMGSQISIRLDAHR